MYIGCIFAMVTGFWFLRSAEALSQTYISGLVGSTVRLPCRIDTKTCGTLHSVKWYRGSSRIFVFSDLNQVKFSKSEGEYEFRANLLYEPNDVMSYLEVKNITNADESIYKCEITYLDVVESCLVVQFINLTTLIAPSYIRVFDNRGNEIEKDSLIGPYNEDEQLTLDCQVGEGKPVPSVMWIKNRELISDNYVVKHGSNAIGSAENKINITVSREDLGSFYECRASSQALNQSLSVSFKIKVHVKPSRVLLSGSKGEVMQNTPVELKCEVFEALPAATVTWYVDNQSIDEKKFKVETKMVLTTDGTTVNTISRLTFTATRNENNKMFKCAARNNVTTELDGSKYEKKTPIRVLYAPIVTIKPAQVTVNESAPVTLECNSDANPKSQSSILWYFNGRLLPHNNSSYEMFDKILRLTKATRNFLGNYFCRVSNDVGTTNSSEVEVNVLFPPTVLVEASTTTTVNESAGANITLFCRVSQGNPRNLTDVLWFFNNTKMYDYVIASNLVLPKVERGLHGNYSCRGLTAAGWGFTSAQKEVFVQYTPGPANITYWILENGTRRDVDLVKKGNTIVLHCNVENLGRPKAMKYNWYEGNRRRENESGITLTLEKVGVREATNLYSCNAENAAGAGPNGSISVNIYAQPTIINHIQYANPTIMDETINMTCDIECYPLCDVSWKRNDELINEGYEYQIVNKKNNASIDKNDFESITSTLVLDLTRFPDGHAVPHRDDALYTCMSTENEAGPGVSAKIHFRVHFPPKEVIVDNHIYDVLEGRVPAKVNCRADARPEATIRWYNDSSGVAFSTDATLNFIQPLSRFTNTNFTCEASNQYGKNSTWVYFNIKYKPMCKVNMKIEGGKKTLTCTANGNPSAIRYNWTMDESEQKNFKIMEEGNVLEVEGNSETRVYNCTAINDVGPSDPCTVSVPASDDWWLFMLLKSHNWSLAYVIIAIVIILVVLIVCILIIFICRKRRAKEKCSGNLTGKNKDSYHSPSDALLQPDSDKTFYENLPFHGMQNPPNKASSHLTNSSPMEYFRLTPSTNTRPQKGNISTNINLKKYKISASNTLSPTLSRGGPPTIPRHHNSSYPSTHQLNNGLVYADLTVSRHKKKYHHRQPPIPNAQTYPYHTEYAVIKFHDVGREIDV